MDHRSEREIEGAKAEDREDVRGIGDERIGRDREKRAESFTLSQTPISLFCLWRMPRSNDRIAITRTIKLDHIHSGVPNHSTNKNEESKGKSPIGTACRKKRSDIARVPRLSPEGPRTSGLVPNWGFIFQRSSGRPRLMRLFAYEATDAFTHS
jgi:hypothetical protein